MLLGLKIAKRMRGERVVCWEISCSVQGIQPVSSLEPRPHRPSHETKTFVYAFWRVYAYRCCVRLFLSCLWLGALAISYARQIQQLVCAYSYSSSLLPGARGRVRSLLLHPLVSRTSSYTIVDYCLYCSAYLQGAYIHQTYHKIRTVAVWLPLTGAR